MIGQRIVLHLKRLLFFILSVLFISIGILHLPIIQNKIFEKFLIHLSNTTNYTFTHKHFQIAWFRYTSLKDLVIKDPKQNVLCQINHVDFTIDPIQLIINKHIAIDHIRINGAQLQLEYDTQGTLNLALLMQKLLEYGSFVHGTYSVNKAILQGINCSLYHPSNRSSWLYRNLGHYVYCHNIQSTLTEITTQGNLVTGKIDLLTCQKSNHALFNDLILNTNFEISPYSLQLKALHAKVTHSFMEGTFSLQSEHQTLLQNITQLATQNINITVLLQNSQFTSSDLSFFIPALKKNFFFQLSGQLKGTLQEFIIPNFQLQFGDKHSILQGNSRLTKNQNNKQTILHLALDHGKLNADDILPFIPKTYHHYIIPCEYLIIKNGSCIGSNIGNIHQYTTQGNIETTLGNIIIPKLVITLDTVKKNVTYQGNITTKDLNIGKLLKNQALGKLSMTTEMRGQEIQPSTATLHLKSKIDKLEIYNYNYQNIHINGIITPKQIKGAIKIQDTNLQCNSSVTVSHKNCNYTSHSLLLKGTLHHASLQSLKLLSIPMQISTQFKLDTEYDSLENLISTLQLDKLYCKHHHTEEIIVQKLKLCNEQHQMRRKLKIDSPLLNLVIEGNFQYAILLNDFKKFLNYIQQDWSQLILLNTTQQPYFINYTIQFKEIMPLLKWYFPHLSITPNIMLKGSFAKGKEAEFSLHISEIPTITYKTYELLNTKLDINGTKLQDENLRSLTVTLNTKYQKWFKKEVTTTLCSLASSLQGNQIIFQQNLMSNELKHQLYIYGEGILCKDIMTISINPYLTLLKINNNLWKINPNNLLTVTQSTMKFNYFDLSNNNQRITLSGILSSQKDDELKIQIKNFQLHNLDDLFNAKIRGTIDAVGVLRDVFHHIVFDGNASAHNIMIDNTTFGDIDLNTTWNNVHNNLKIHCQLYQEQKQVVVLKGVYNPTQKKENLSLALNLNAMQAAIFTPFVKGIFSDLHGTLSGNFIISGPLSHIKVNGRGIISHVTLKIDYLNTTYHLHNPFMCVDQTIYFNEIKFTDSKSGIAIFKGRIFYKPIEGFYIDLKGNVQSLYILNTTIKQNENFYGTGIITGTITIVGPLNNIMIHANATTDRGTFTIAANNKQHTIQNGLVQFRNLKSVKKEKSFSKISTNTKKTRKIDLSLDLKLTPSVQTIVLLNSDQGDLIQGCGNGTIKIEVGSTKPLRLTGNYRLDEGICYFFVYGLIRKIFKIKKDTQVIWHGDPYSGMLNLQATYEQEVSLLPLLEKQDTNMTEAERILVEIILNIQGTLLIPHISFGINFKEKPTNPELCSKIDAFNAKILTNKSYLDSQIFSLIAFKGFFKNNQLNLHNAVGVSMSEFIAQQLRTLSTNIDKNFEIEANLGLQSWNNLKNNFLQDSKVRLSYYFLNKSLRISSAIGSQSNFVNDLMITYKINKNINIKLYSTPSKKDTLSSRGGGISLGYTKDFGR